MIPAISYFSGKTHPQIPGYLTLESGRIREGSGLNEEDDQCKDKKASVAGDWEQLWDLPLLGRSVPTASSRSFYNNPSFRAVLWSPRIHSWIPPVSEPGIYHSDRSSVSDAKFPAGAAR